MSVDNDSNAQKFRETIVKILKSLFDFRNIIKLAELVLLMIYKLLYGKQSVFTW